MLNALKFYRALYAPRSLKHRLVPSTVLYLSFLPIILLLYTLLDLLPIGTDLDRGHTLFQKTSLGFWLLSLKAMPLEQFRQGSLPRQPHRKPQHFSDIDPLPLKEPIQFGLYSRL